MQGEAHGARRLSFAAVMRLLKDNVTSSSQELSCLLPDCHAPSEAFQRSSAPRSSAPMEKRSKAQLSRARARRRAFFRGFQRGVVTCQGPPGLGGMNDVKADADDADALYSNACQTQHSQLLNFRRSPRLSVQGFLVSQIRIQDMSRPSISIFYCFAPR